jgi:hypothetical protein
MIKLYLDQTVVCHQACVGYGDVNPVIKRTVKEILQSRNLLYGNYHYYLNTDDNAYYGELNGYSQNLEKHVMLEFGPLNHEDFNEIVKPLLIQD